MCGSALDWKSLSPGSVVVDVGGGVGLVSSALAKAFPHLRYVVQDLEKVIFEGRQVSHRHFGLLLFFRVTL